MEKIKDLDNFILENTKFTFENLDSLRYNLVDDSKNLMIIGTLDKSIKGRMKLIKVSAHFNYYDMNVSLEGITMDGDQSTSNTINELLRFMKGTSPMMYKFEKAYKIYQRDINIKNIL